MQKSENTETKPRLFQLWDEILNSSDSANVKAVNKKTK